MTQDAYINQILIPEVLPWILRGDDFVLEENGDSGHGPRPGSKVCQWKDKHNLNSYLNCALSPDLAPIENSWFPVKNEVRKTLHWDEQTTMELALEGWTNIKQSTIDKWVESMPQRLQAVIANNGKLTAF